MNKIIVGMIISGEFCLFDISDLEYIKKVEISEDFQNEIVEYLNNNELTLLNKKNFIWADKLKH